MDLGILQDYYIMEVLIACLIGGYCIKHIKWLEKLSNQYIPSILAILGAILACIQMAESSMPITLKTIIYGAFTGLASTGMHQAFKNIINKLGDK